MELSELLKTENLIKWLESKPRDEKYNYFNGPRCAITTYLFQHGHDDLCASICTVHRGVPMEGGGWNFNDPTPIATFPIEWNEAAKAKGASDEGQKLWTYGQMLDRLRQLTGQPEVIKVEPDAVSTAQVLEPAE